MTKINFTLLTTGVILLILGGCGDKTARNESMKMDLSQEEISTEKVRQIFYHMYLPSEMTRLFERTGANYDPTIPNSFDKLSRYSRPDSIALNLGIYGVDLGYTRIFDQTISSAKYLEAIQVMSSKMGIPGNYYQDLLLAFEQHKQNTDSLAALVGAIYHRADEYLKENKMETYSAMIIFGGWIEAVYIACRIAGKDEGNIEIIERIAAQKYSLNSIIALLSNYQDDPGMAENILMLKQLRKSFDKISITYNQNDFRIDTLTKSISSQDLTVDIPENTIDEISGLVSQIRNSIVN